MAEAYVVLRWTVRRSTVPGLLVSRVAGGQIAQLGLNPARGSL